MYRFMVASSFYTLTRAGLCQFDLYIQFVYNLSMIFDDDFEWDDPKDLTNQENHGYTFEEARLIWEDHVYTYQDRRVYPNNEIRHIAIGYFDPHTILFVVYTWRGQRKHLISAREAEEDETTKFLARYRSRRR